MPLICNGLSDMHENLYDAIIIGAGAAGLMCALTAGRRGCRVLLLDHADQVGAKILISGGGRCNFTNRATQPSRFLSQNPHYATSALARYTPHDFIALVNKHRIAFHEKTLGQLFCDSSAKAIVRMLLDECEAGHVDIRLQHTIAHISRPDQFYVETSGGTFRAPALVLATGGLSIPKMGATNFSHAAAVQFGLRLTPPLPGLVPFTIAAGEVDFFKNLAGVSVDSTVACNGGHFRENILFTHRGLSGPSILQISSYWRQGHALTINMAPDIDVLEFLKGRKAARPKAEVRTVLADILPARLADALVTKLGLGGPVADLSHARLLTLAQAVQTWTLKPAGTEGYAKAEVTLGGVDTADLSSKTMQAKNVAGLYVIGEAVDVTGWLGGYNFQWAWSSGWVAGMHV
jgi:predicted Rossmann fold flavoprotein